MKNNSNERFQAMLEEKIKEMESTEYIFPKRFSKNDYIITMLFVVVSLICIIAGAWL